MSSRLIELNRYFALQVFAQHRYLSVHIARVHNKKKKYTCEECGKGFFEKFRWKLHK